jgi:cytochrome P450
VADRADGRQIITSRDPYFNPLDPDFLRDPYPAYALLRAQQPVYWHEGMGLWLVSRYHDVAAVSADHGRFASDYRRAGVAEEPDALSVQTLDPPGQLPVRRLLVAAARSTDLAALEAAARTDAASVLASAGTGVGAQGTARAGTVDFVADVAMPFSLMSAARVLGVSLDMAGHLGEVRQISDSTMPALRPDLVQPGADSRRRLSQAIAACYDAGEDTGMIGFARRSAASGDIPRDLLISSLRVTLMAIVNSTSRFLCLALQALLSHSSLEAFASVSAPALAAAELVRFDSSIQVQEKVCVEPVNVAGVPVRRGERVVVLYGSANRDETVFTEPDRLVLDRSPNPHLGFGRGAHSCLGAAVGIALCTAFLDTIARAYPDTELRGDPEMDANPTIRGMRSMPVRLAA